MSDDVVLVRKQGRVGRITLNRPKALHALNFAMCTTITTALLAWRNDPDVDVVVVDHAEGTRGFCAGGDVLFLAESGRDDGRAGAEFFALEYRLNTLIKEYPKPYVALMDGVTMGGGVGISVHGTHRVATERTVFAMPEAGIGLAPDVGGGYFLSRLDGELGMWLALSGARLKGQDVLAAGIATHFMSSDELAGLVEALCAEGIAALPPPTGPVEASYEPHRAEIDRAFSAGSVEEIIDRLQAGSEWAKGAAHEMAAKSPLTMKVAHRQLRLGKEQTFRDVMAMEFRICTRMIKTPNFQEGVRAVLVDRDNNPAWSPSALDDIDHQAVSIFFEDLGRDELSFKEIEK
ncbi:MAG: enoyl-CoA hydratase/isomerase family protein [Pseudomonadota bacterium]